MHQLSKRQGSYKKHRVKDTPAMMCTDYEMCWLGLTCDSIGLNADVLNGAVSRRHSSTAGEERALAPAHRPPMSLPYQIPGLYKAVTLPNLGKVTRCNDTVNTGRPQYRNDRIPSVGVQAVGDYRSFSEGCGTENPHLLEVKVQPSGGLLSLSVRCLLLLSVLWTNPTYSCTLHIGGIFFTD